jgi:hypothetical protein
VHFGLGRNQGVNELTVRWPGGTITRIEKVGADQIVTARP